MFLNKLPFVFGLTFGCIVLFSCGKDSAPDLNCDEKVLIPESYLDWFPYFSMNGETLPNRFFEGENQTFFLVQQEIDFLNENQDTQSWILNYVIEEFEEQQSIACPLSQQIKYTLYNGAIDKHIDFGFAYIDTTFNGMSNDFETYKPNIIMYLCRTEGEKEDGVLYGTCPWTNINMDDYSRNSRVEYFDIFESGDNTYNQVFLVKLDQSLEPFHIYFARDIGIFAYQTQGEFWELK